MRQTYFKWGQGLGVFLFAVLGCAGCSEVETEAPVQNTCTLRGSVNDVHINAEPPEKFKAFNLSKAAVAALIPDEQGVFAPVVGKGRENGELAVPGVPGDATLFLRLGVQGAPVWFVETQGCENRIEFGFQLLRRPDATFPIKPTSIVFNVDGLEPWQDTDFLQLFSMNAGALGIVPLAGVMPGSTNVSGVSVSYSSFDTPFLIDTDKGDDVTLMQLVGGSSNGVEYASVKSVMRPSHLIVNDGGETVIEGKLEPVMPLVEQEVTWSDEYATLAADVHPLAKVSGQSLGIYADPTGESLLESNDARPYLVSTLSEVPAGASFSLSFGNPFPEESELIGVAASWYEVELMLSGDPFTVPSAILHAEPLDSFFSGPVAPRLHPPQDIRINDQSAVAALSSVGESPVVSWSVPDMETPSRFRVYVYRADLMQKELVEKAVIFTTSRSLRIPPRILEVGGTYCLRVQSIRMPDDTPTMIYRRTSTYASADAVTHFFTP